MFTFVMLVVVVIVAAVVKSIKNGSNQNAEAKARVKNAFDQHDKLWGDFEHFKSIKSSHNIHDLNRDNYFHKDD